MKLTLLAQQLAGHARQLVARQAARDLLTTAGTNLVLAGSSAAGGILAARLLGPAGRGELAVAVVWAGILGIIASLGMPQALTYFAAREAANVGQIVHTAFVLLVVQSLVSVLIGQAAIAVWLTGAQPEAVRSAQLYLFSIPAVMVVTYLSTIAQGLRRFRLFNLLRVASAAGYLASLVTALLADAHRAQDVIVLLLTAQFLVASLAVAVFRWKVRPHGRFEARWAGQLLRYGLRSYWGSLSWMANIRLDQFIMSALVGLNALGIYAVAVSYATVIYPISGAVAMVIFPRVAQDNYGQARPRIVRALKLNLLVSGAAALSLGILAHQLLPFLFGQQFVPAVGPAYVLLAAGLFLGSSYVLSDGLRGLGFPAIPSLAEAVGAAVTVLGLLLLLPVAGMYGAAWVSLLSYVSASLIMLARFLRLTGRGEDKRQPIVENTNVA